MIYLMSLVYAVLSMVAGYVGYTTSMRRDSEGQQVSGWFLTVILVGFLLGLAYHPIPS